MTEGRERKRKFGDVVAEICAQFFSCPKKRREKRKRKKETVAMELPKLEEKRERKKRIVVIAVLK